MNEEGEKRELKGDVEFYAALGAAMRDVGVSVDRVRGGDDFLELHCAKVVNGVVERNSFLWALHASSRTTKAADVVDAAKFVARVLEGRQ